jgi:hypothetical protein
MFFRRDLVYSRARASIFILAVLVCFGSGQECSTPDVVIPPMGLPPVVLASTDYAFVSQGDTVELTADAINPDGDDSLLTYLWSVIGPDGYAQTVTNATAAQATFVADMLGIYVCRCDVGDDGTVTPIRSNNVYVTAIEERIGGGPPNNQPPALTAELVGSTGFPGRQIDMIATATDSDPVWYQWTQVSGYGPSVTINDPNTAEAYFYSPQVSSCTTMRFQIECGDRWGATRELQLNFWAYPEPYVNASLTDSQDPVYPGTEYYYTLTINNVSTSQAATGIHVEVSYPVADLLVLSTTPQGQVSGNTITWNLSYLGPGQHTNLIYRVQVRSNVTGLPKQIHCPSHVTVQEYPGDVGPTAVTYILPLQ